MPNSPGEENKETQGVADNRNMGTDYQEKTTKRPDQPNASPRREAGIVSTLLGQKPGNEKRRKKRQGKLHSGADPGSRDRSGPKKHEKTT